MVDFKRLLAEERARRTPEEKAHHDKYDALVKLHTYYETTTMMEKHSKDGKVEEEQIEVKLFSRVDFHSLEVGNKILLDFSPSPSYHFDNSFLERYGIRLLEGGTGGMTIDMGRGLKIKPSEMQRIIKEGCLAIENGGFAHKMEDN